MLVQYTYASLGSFFLAFISAANKGDYIKIDKRSQRAASLLSYFPLSVDSSLFVLGFWAIYRPPGYRNLLEFPTYLKISGPGEIVVCEELVLVVCIAPRPPLRRRRRYLLHVETEISGEQSKPKGSSGEKKRGERC